LKSAKMALKLAAANKALIASNPKLGKENAVAAACKKAAGGQDENAGCELQRPARRVPLTCISNNTKQTAGYLHVFVGDGI
jgi:hypothetical protein